DIAGQLAGEDGYFAFAVRFKIICLQQAVRLVTVNAVDDVAFLVDLIFAGIDIWPAFQGKDGVLVISDTRPDRYAPVLSKIIIIVHRQLHALVAHLACINGRRTKAADIGNRGFQQNAVRSFIVVVEGYFNTVLVQSEVEADIQQVHRFPGDIRVTPGAFHTA